MSRVLISLVFALAACNAGALSQNDLGPSGGGDLALPPGSDLAGNPGGGDGTPMQGACTAQFGSGMSAGYGRLDGFVWAVVPLGDRQCRGDRDHVHLQVKMNGAIYNIAVTAVDMQGGEVFFAERDLAVPGSWSEGWHPGAQLDYPALGLHSGDFAATPGAAIEQAIKSALANANHISVFTTGFGPDGGHKVHRNGRQDDGAVVLNPLSVTPRVLVFHFANQQF